MLWKKRWFALSQYCLFYYDGKPNNNNNSFCGNYAEKRLVFFYSSRRYFFFFFFSNENALLKMRQTEVAQRTEMSREGLCSTCRVISLIIRDDDTHTAKERIKRKRERRKKVEQFKIRQTVDVCDSSGAHGKRTSSAVFFLLLLSTTKVFYSSGGEKQPTSNKTCSFSVCVCVIIKEFRRRL